MEANLEIEMIGRPDSLAGGPGRAWLTGFERSTMGEMFAAAGLAVVPDKRPGPAVLSAQRQHRVRAHGHSGAHAVDVQSAHRLSPARRTRSPLVDFAHMAGVINIGVKAVGLLANGPAPRWNPGGKP